MTSSDEDSGDVLAVQGIGREAGGESDSEENGSQYCAALSTSDARAINQLFSDTALARGKLCSEPDVQPAEQRRHPNIA